MLIGDGWAFVHIPKCGGTAVRQVLTGSEKGNNLLLGDRGPILSPWHRLPDKRPIGCVFTIVRRPSDWIRSWWLDQSPERVGNRTWLHKLWRADMNEFALALCDEYPGYVGQLYRSVFEDTVIFRLEDGIDRAIKSATGLDVDAPKRNPSIPAQKFNQNAMTAIEIAESETMEKFSYAYLSGW